MATFDDTQEAFREKPTKKTAGYYLEALLEYESDDMIGDDTFLDGLAEIAHWLTKEKQ